MAMGVFNDMRVNSGTCETIRDPDLPYLRVKDRRRGRGGGSRSCEDRGIKVMAPLRRHGLAQRSRLQQTQGTMNPLHSTITGSKDSKESETYLLSQESHRECLIKQPQFSTLTLLIIGVTKDPTIQQRSMDIGHHVSDIPRAVGGFTIRWEFDAVEVGVDRWVEVERVAFVEGVDLASGWDSDLRCLRGKDKIGYRERVVTVGSLIRSGKE